MALEFRSALRTLFSESLCCLRFSKKLCSLQTQVQTSGSDISLQGHISPSSPQKALPGELTSQSWTSLHLTPQTSLRCHLLQQMSCGPDKLPQACDCLSILSPANSCPDVSGSFSLIDYSRGYHCCLWRKNPQQGYFLP